MNNPYSIGDLVRSRYGHFGIVLDIRTDFSSEPRLEVFNLTTGVIYLQLVSNCIATGLESLA